MSRVWERAIILVDMNAFFASVEQLDHPELQGRAIGITNGATGTCVITCSYEARLHGISTGMRVKEARKLCPDFIQIPARPERYAAASTAIMEALQSITPDLEIFSVDEAFLDVTHCQQLGTPERLGLQAKEAVYDVSGLLCSVGVSGDKTTAKWAAKQSKPNGFTVVPPWEAEARLRNVPVTELCGIAKGIGRYLAERGVYTCGDMASLPVSELGRRFGNLGRRIWLMTQGRDPEKLVTHVAPPKSVGHGKVMPPNTVDEPTILTYLEQMSFKIGTRLRRHGLVAQTYSLALRTQHYGWIGGIYKTALPGNDARILMDLCRRMLVEHWYGQGVCQTQITALDPRPENSQLELFTEWQTPEKQTVANRVMDEINGRFGEYALAPARLVGRSSMPNVIAPAWKPYGHRQTI